MNTRHLGVGAGLVNEHEAVLLEVELAFAPGGEYRPNTVRLHRVLTTRPDKVYRAFIEPDAIASWLPPFGFLCTVHELDARAGGRHRKLAKLVELEIDQ